MYDEQKTKTEHDTQEIANNAVMEDFGLQNPINIMFDKYSLCEIVCQSKLSKFFVGMLGKICINLLELDAITSKSKQPYMDILQGVLKGKGRFTNPISQFS